MAKNTIKLKKYVDIINEYTAAAAIMPGMLIELITAGTVRAHATAAGNVAKMFALEDELQGNGIDTAYAAADRVQCWNPVPGEEVFAILSDGETVVKGDFLSSNGDGYLRKHVAETESWRNDESGAHAVTVSPNAIVAIALEAVDLSASSGESGESSGTVGGAIGYNKRISVRIV